MLAATGAAAAAYTASCTSGVQTDWPPTSAVGQAVPVPPPNIHGKKARLLQCTCIVRHGARTPVSDSALSPKDSCEWSVEDTRKPSLGVKAALIQHGTGDVLDPAQVFAVSESAFMPGGFEPAKTLDGGAVPGALTRIGLQQAYELGGELRERYVDKQATTSGEVRPEYLLPYGWERARRLVATRSTFVERTVYTATGIIAGMWPSDASAGSLAVDIATNGSMTTFGGSEFMLLNTKGCERLQELFKQGLGLSTGHRDAEQQRVLRAVEAATGWDVSVEAWKLIAYRDWVACRRACGKPLPAGVDGPLASALDRAAQKQMHQIFEGGAPFTTHPEATRTESLRLTIGRLWSYILGTLDRPDGSFHLLSGHDWTVGPLLACVARVVLGRVRTPAGS